MMTLSNIYTAIVSFALAAVTAAIPVTAHNNANNKLTPANISCISTAVQTRETSIDQAFSTYASAVESIYSARASGLQSAYTGTDVTTIKKAVNAVWKSENTQKAAARQALTTARTAAWTTFKTNEKSCGASVTAVDDTANQSSDTAN